MTHCPSFDEIVRHRRTEDARRVGALMRRHGVEAAAIFAAIRQECEREPTVTLFREGMSVAWAALNLEEINDDRTPSAAGCLARELAILLVREYARPQGGFFEYDWNSWVPGEDMWRTIPWGTAFHGHVLLEVSQRISGSLPGEERDFWTNHLERTGLWIYRNPVCGAFVFNCGIHLLSLLWRLGKTLARPEWCHWALDTAHFRLSRDVDSEGWITAEDGGVSGLYQMLGAGFLAQFARESGDSFLRSTSRKIFDLHMRFASTELQWAGNFGTRSSWFGALMPQQILEEAADGNGRAAALLRRCGTIQWADDGTDWSRHVQPLFDEELWRRALATEPAAEPPSCSNEYFPGIQSSVVRSGGFTAWFFDYPKSVWARGFAALTHRTGPVFSTLHSLPTEVDKKKLLLGDTTDWAGFPHVQVEGSDESWHSQQQMSPPEINSDGRVSVAWTESLLNRQGSGGKASFACHFETDGLRLGINLSDLKGSATLDFHIQREGGNFTGYWLGEEARDIQAGRVPACGGQYWDREFAPGEVPLAAVQNETILYVWEILECPEGTHAILGLRKKEGLHTRNRGGVRLRLQPPPNLRTASLQLRFSILAP